MALVDMSVELSFGRVSRSAGWAKMWAGVISAMVTAEMLGLSNQGCGKNGDVLISSY